MAAQPDGGVAMGGGITIHHADMLEWLRAYAEQISLGEAEPFDSCVTDPPYHLSSIVRRFGKPGSAAAKVPEGGTGAYARASKGFMGKEWDGGDVAFRPETWRAVYDCLKPGAHLVAFSGTRTYHRMACAIEDAGFEIRDQLQWLYGSGFPKSHDISKAIDKAAGAQREVVATEKVRDIRNGNGRKHGEGIHAAERDAPVYMQRNITAPETDNAKAWQGWGTALKPACEPICLARKPLTQKSVAAQVLATGTGAINIDRCRIEGQGGQPRDGEASQDRRYSENGSTNFAAKPGPRGGSPDGRWPANVIHDASSVVEHAFPDAPGQQRVVTGQENSSPFAHTYGDMPERAGSAIPRGDSGSAARFFYSAKAGPLDRIGSKHATVKPVDLMRWLCRLITPRGGTVLEPFAGSGTTGIAAMTEGFSCTMLELEAEHVADIERKLAFLRGEGAARIAEHRRDRDTKPDTTDVGPLFGNA